MLKKQKKEKKGKLFIKKERNGILLSYRFSKKTKKKNIYIYIYD